MSTCFESRSAGSEAPCSARQAREEPGIEGGFEQQLLQLAADSAVDCEGVRREVGTAGCSTKGHADAAGCQRQGDDASQDKELLPSIKCLPKG